MKIIRNVLAVIAATAVAACTLTVDTDELEGGCPPDTKLCEGECVSTNLTAFSCNESGCAPCTVAGASAICGGGGFCQIGACLMSSRNCNGAQDDGCEVDINTDPQHCGGCFQPCQLTANAVEMDCGNGRCFVRVCQNGFGDCDSATNTSNGCETNLDEDTEHCGECGAACEVGQTCVDGECV